MKKDFEFRNTHFSKLVMCLLLGIFMMGFPACGDDDDDDNNDKDKSIVGIWSDDGTDNWYNEGGDAYGFKFTANGQYTEYGSIHESGKYYIDGDELTLKSNDGDLYEYRFNISGDALTLIDYYDKYDYEIYYRVK